MKNVRAVYNELAVWWWTGRMPPGRGPRLKMHGDFDEDEDPDFEPDDPADDEMCIDCQRLGSMMDECCVCGASMCSACFEMGCGVCKGPHRK